MKSLKKIIIITLLSFVLSLQLSTSSAQNFFYEQSTPITTDDLNVKLNLANTIKQDSLEPSNTILGDIMDLFGLQSYQNQDRPALAYIQMIINLLLGLTSFIALIVVIFAFYQIFFNKGEEGVTKAKKMLSGVAIALAVMGLSWMIVSFILYLYSTQTNTNISLLDSNITDVV